MKLLRSKLYNFWVWSYRSLSEVAENHLSISFSKLLPRSEHDVVEGLLEVELGDWSYGSAETALCNCLAHGADNLRILVHEIVVSQHLCVCCESSTRKWEEWNFWVNLCCLWREEVVCHALFEDLFCLLHLLDVDVESVVCASQCMPHCDDVWLTCSAGDRRHGKVNLACTGFDGCHVLLD